MDSSFFALISRMRNISRWSLMRNTFSDNVQEHSHMVAVLAHALAVIRRDVFGKAIDPGRVAAAALFHDASEIITGDLPTPIKYHNQNLMNAYKEVEQLACEKLLSTLPDELRGSYRNILLFEDDADVHQLVKAADKLAAYIKCVEELGAGNTEFRKALEQTSAALERLALPEVEYFKDHFIAAFSATVDELEL